MQNIKDIIILLDNHIEDINFANSNIATIQSELNRRKNDIRLVRDFEISLKKNKKNVYIQILLSFVIIGFILYLIF
ncbi:hypothetical protein V3Q77_03000 [Flavobacterium davisii]|uniref:Uncharacterized protein n=1 Tax=Flavobacterium davisii TaxID=2906077 RepID=A0ABW8PLN0_9FLAO